MLSYYGLPLSAVKAILLTQAYNMNFFECMVKLEKICLISEEEIYKEIKRKLQSYFYWNEIMIKNRVKVKVLVDKDSKNKIIKKDINTKDWNG